MKKQALILFCLLLAGRLLAQQTVVKGRVTDATTLEPISFASVVFWGSSIGTTTDFNGFFELSTTQRFDTIAVQFVGYKMRKKPVVPGQVQTINFQLETDNVILTEITVLPGANPAHRILKQAWKHKDDNDMRKLETYQYESYTKLRLDVDKISDEFKQRKIMKPFQYIFDSLKVAAGEDGNMVLPLYISETLSDFFYQANPELTKEVVKATNIKGVGMEDGQLLSQFSGSSFHTYNFYRNNVEIIDKSFISPISNDALGYYIHILEDSLMINRHWCYQIKVVPKRKEDLAFHGTIWIADTSFALAKLSLEIGDEANINFIERLRIQQEYQPCSAGPWLPSQTRLLVDIMEPTKESFGMLAKVYISYQDVVVNQPYNEKQFKVNIEVNADAQVKSDEFWKEQRHEALSIEDETIFNIVDSIRNFPKLRSYIEVAKILTGGYIKVHPKIELGSYLLLYGTNVVEQHRFRLGFRTTANMSKNWSFKTYAAYGVRDQRFKYGATAEIFLRRKNWLKMGLQYKNDLEGIGAMESYEEQGAIQEAATQLGLLQRMNKVELGRIWFSGDLHKSVNQKIAFTSKYLHPEGNFVFAYYQDPKVRDKLKTDINITEISLETKWTPLETKVINENERISFYTSKAPAFTFRYNLGLKNVLGSEFSYHKFSIDINQIARAGKWGRAEYLVRYQKVLTPLPYTLLNIFPGNQTFIRSFSTFNTMNFFEFVADQSLMVMYVHHFDGILMNRIPLMRKLKWRAVTSTKMAWGTMSKTNLSLLPAFNEQGVAVTPFKTLNPAEPYMEIGYGFENVFKFIRIQAFHRLNYHDGTRNSFAVKGSVYFNF